MASFLDKQRVVRTLLEQPSTRQREMFLDEHIVLIVAHLLPRARKRIAQETGLQRKLSEITSLPQETAERVLAPRSVVSGRPGVESPSELDEFSRQERVPFPHRQDLLRAATTDMCPRNFQSRNTGVEAPDLALLVRSGRIHRAAYILPPVLLGFVCLKAIRHRGRFSHPSTEAQTDG